MAVDVTAGCRSAPRSVRSPVAYLAEWEWRISPFCLEVLAGDQHPIEFVLVRCQSRLKDLNGRVQHCLQISHPRLASELGVLVLQCAR